MLNNVFNFFQKFLYHFLHAESMVKTNHICHKVQFGVNLNVYKHTKKHSPTNTNMHFLLNQPLLPYQWQFFNELQLKKWTFGEIYSALTIKSGKNSKI